MSCRPVAHEEEEAASSLPPSLSLVAVSEGRRVTHIHHRGRLRGSCVSRMSHVSGGHRLGEALPLSASAPRVPPPPARRPGRLALKCWRAICDMCPTPRGGASTTSGATVAGGVHTSAHCPGGPPRRGGHPGSNLSLWLPSQLSAGVRPHTTASWTKMRSPASHVDGGLTQSTAGRPATQTHP